jgi:hypothetical protein
MARLRARHLATSSRYWQHNYTCSYLRNRQLSVTNLLRPIVDGRSATQSSGRWNQRSANVGIKKARSSSAVILGIENKVWLAYVATRLTRFPFLPARRSDQSAAPEADHLPGALRDHGCRLALCLRGGAAARRAQHSIGSAQPHTHKRVLFHPGISHVRFSLPLSNARGWNHPRCGSLTPRYTSLPLEAHSPSKYSASSSERGRTPITMPPDLMPAS